MSIVSSKIKSGIIIILTLIYIILNLSALVQDIYLDYDDFIVEFVGSFEIGINKIDHKEGLSGTTFSVNNYKCNEDIKIKSQSFDFVKKEESLCTSAQNSKIASYVFNGLLFLVVFAAINPEIDSACIKSIFPFKKARYENSPGAASRTFSE